MEQRTVSEGLSRQELLGSLKESKLLSAEELKRVEAIDPAADAGTLAKAIVATGLVTSFQMDEVVNQRFERLHIGNYDLLDKLGSGGTGTVYKARHRRMKRVVALKVLARNLCKDKSFVQRFQREVETIAQLSHPNIVMAHDADEAKIGHFLVMEFVNGEDLASVVQKQGPMSVADAVSAILQAARGLAYVHEQGMIHRDMKPANLLRDGTGRVKVTDLGLARFSSGAGGAANINALTQAGGVLGSVDYMPPEQALDSTTIDHRADIYSLGATLFYLLSGRPPYPGQTMMETLLKHRDAPIPSLTALRPDVPPALDDILRRMLAKTVDQRYQSMADAVRDLEAVQANLSAGAGRVPTDLPLGSSEADSVTGLPRSSRRDTVFPRAATDRTMSLTPEVPSAAPNASLTVLVVEPSRTQASIIRKYLHSQNIDQVVAVTSGREALKMVRSVCPDAVVSTMHLTDMTGIELVRKLRAEFETAGPGFVLLHSEAEHADSDALNQCRQAVALQKPYTPEKLIEVLSLVSGQLLAAQPVDPAQLGMTMVRPVKLQPLPPPAAAPSAHADRRVLIVDDSATARRQCCSVLASLGVVQCTEAKDGAEAVALLARGSFDLIITDYNMPLMDGGSVVAYLKQNPATASIPVIMITTEKDPQKLAAVRKEGVAICGKALPPEVVQNILDQLPHS
jgi:serine/threonine protein kinase